MSTSTSEPLNIYFCGSICGGRQDADIYAQLIEFLKTYGKVLTERIGLPNVAERDAKADDKFVYKRCMDWFKEADVLIAEVTQPSLGVGFEIGWAACTQKPTLCLFRTSSDTRLSNMVGGASNGASFVVEKYSDVSEAMDLIKNYLVDFKKL